MTHTIFIEIQFLKRQPQFLLVSPNVVHELLEVNVSILVLVSKAHNSLATQRGGQWA